MQKNGKSEGNIEKLRRLPDAALPVGDPASRPLSSGFRRSEFAAIRLREGIIVSR